MVLGAIADRDDVATLEEESLSRVQQALESVVRPGIEGVIQDSPGTGVASVMGVTCDYNYHSGAVPHYYLAASFLLGGGGILTITDRQSQGCEEYDDLFFHINVHWCRVCQTMHPPGQDNLRYVVFSLPTIYYLPFNALHRSTLIYRSQVGTTWATLIFPYLLPTTYYLLPTKRSAVRCIPQTPISTPPRSLPRWRNSGRSPRVPECDCPCPGPPSPAPLRSSSPCRYLCSRAPP
jgi:hypothetical protein